MKIVIKSLGVVGANCGLIVSKKKNAAIVDPGGDVEKIFEMLRQQQATLKMVLLTHGHFDHIAGLWELLAQVDVPVYIHAEDGEMLDDIEKALCGMISLYFPYQAGLQYHALGDGDVVRLDELEIRLLHTPGHTKGSACYQVGEALFSGDTLLADTVGRTDLPGGDSAILRRSLRRLLTLKENYTICAGHGPQTTLARERQHNPYLQE